MVLEPTVKGQHQPEGSHGLRGLAVCLDEGMVIEFCKLGCGFMKIIAIPQLEKVTPSCIKTSGSTRPFGQPFDLSHGP